MKNVYSVRINQEISDKVVKVESKLKNCTTCFILKTTVDWTSKNIFKTKLKKKTINKIVEKAEKIPSKKGVCFRYDKDVIERLKRYFDVNSNTEVIKCCIITFIEYYNSNKFTSGQLSSREYLVSRAGAKKGIVLDLVENANKDIMHKKDISAYVEPFMGTANVFAHLPQPEANCVKKYLNDAECDIVNFFKVLQEDFDGFINALPSEANPEVFQQMVLTRKTIKLPTRSKKKQIASAVAFYCTLLLSYYGDMQSFRKEATSKTLDNKINTIRKVAELLEDVSISKNDWEYFLKKIMNVPKNEKEKVLIYADPPYIFTEKVYDASKKGFNHKKFGKQLISYGEEGATFLLSYRATARKKSKYTNADVQEVLDSIYMGDKSYIAFTWASKRKNETQVEVLISNVKFKGSVKYDKNIAILMKQQGFA